MPQIKKPIFMKVLLLVLLSLVIESVVLLYLYSPKGISGFSIIDLSEIYSKFYPSSKIFLIVQWALIAVILLVVYIKNMGIHKRNEEVKNIDLSSAMKKAKTKLDAYYSIIQEKKSLSVKTLSTLFEIDTDLAMEWARILESSGLVLIDYPGFGSPVVHIVEKETPVSLNPKIEVKANTKEIKKIKK